MQTKTETEKPLGVIYMKSALKKSTWTNSLTAHNLLSIILFNKEEIQNSFYVSGLFLY